MLSQNPHAVYPVVSLVNNKLVTTSMNVAEVFGKQHKDVLEAIRNMDIPEDFTERNFPPSEYTDPTGRKLSMFNLTRDGFTLLVMGFTGSRAMQFKLAYIEAFNRMQAVLTRKKASSPDPELSDEAIPDHVWQRIRDAGQKIRLPYRVKLLRLACQMTRIDKTAQHTRESVLMNYVALCTNLCAPSASLSVDEGDPIGEFIDECCVVDPLARGRASAIFERFVLWHHDNVGGNEPTGTWFGRRLAERFRKSKSNGCMIYYGIGLSETTKEEGPGRTALEESLREKSAS